MEDNKVRINKYLAEAGICSRRGADELILQGKVTINGKIAQNGDKVGPGDDVRVSGKKASNETEKVVLAYYIFWVFAKLLFAKFDELPLRDGCECSNIPIKKHILGNP